MSNFTSEDHDLEWLDEETGEECFCTLTVDVEFEQPTGERFNCAGEPGWWHTDTSYDGDEPPEYLIEQKIAMTIRNM